MAKPESRARARELGIRIGRFETGEWNAITDIAGVTVGQETLIAGSGPLQVGKGPVRTGVTVIVPHEGSLDADPLFAGYHQLNGNGEMTGVLWIEESGLLTTPIAITNTHSVGIVRDAIVAYGVQEPGAKRSSRFSLPVVGETFDGHLNDIDGFHVRQEHLFAAMRNAQSGPVQEGCCGGGTGMISFGFKGGSGTSSRKLHEKLGGWTVAAFVQANFGQRHLFRVDGVAVGEQIAATEVPTPWVREWTPGEGSIIAIVATDAPLLPNQCKRLAQRATIGVARTGGLGEDSSGDLFLAFSTGNRGFETGTGGQPMPVQVFPSDHMSVLFEATAEVVEESILNAMCMATTMTGIDDRVVHALPLDRLQEIMQKAGRLFPGDAN